MILYILKNALLTSEQIADLQTQKNYIIPQHGPAVSKLIKIAMKHKQNGRIGR